MVVASEGISLALFGPPLNIVMKGGGGGGEGGGGMWWGRYPIGNPS